MSEMLINREWLLAWFAGIPGNSCSSLEMVVETECGTARFSGLLPSNLRRRITKTVNCGLGTDNGKKTTMSPYAMSRGQGPGNSQAFSYGETAPETPPEEATRAQGVSSNNNTRKKNRRGGSDSRARRSRARQLAFLTRKESEREELMLQWLLGFQGLQVPGGEKMQLETQQKDEEKQLEIQQKAKETASESQDGRTSKKRKVLSPLGVTDTPREDLRERDDTVSELETSTIEPSAQHEQDKTRDSEKLVEHADLVSSASHPLIGDWVEETDRVSESDSPLSKLEQAIAQMRTQESSQTSSKTESNLLTMLQKLATMERKEKKLKCES